MRTGGMKPRPLHKPWHTEILSSVKKNKKNVPTKEVENNTYTYSWVLWEKVSSENS